MSSSSKGRLNAFRFLSHSAILQNHYKKQEVSKIREYLTISLSDAPMVETSRRDADKTGMRNLENLFSV